MALLDKMNLLAIGAESIFSTRGSIHCYIHEESIMEFRCTTLGRQGRFQPVNAADDEHFHTLKIYMPLNLAWVCRAGAGDSVGDADMAV